MSAPLSAILNPSGAISSPSNTNLSSPSPLSTPKKIHMQLTQDKWIWICVLWDIEWKYKNIAAKYNASLQVVQWVCTHSQIPKKWSDRPLRLSEKQVKSLVEFVTVSKTNWWLFYWCLPSILDFNCSAWSVQYVLQQWDFRWCLTHQKSSISSKNQWLQLVWTHKHLN